MPPECIYTQGMGRQYVATAYLVTTGEFEEAMRLFKMLACTILHFYIIYFYNVFAFFYLQIVRWSDGLLVGLFFCEQFVYHFVYSVWGRGVCAQVQTFFFMGVHMYTHWGHTCARACPPLTHTETHKVADLLFYRGIVCVDYLVKGEAAVFELQLGEAFLAVDVHFFAYHGGCGGE